MMRRLLLRPGPLLLVPALFFYAALLDAQPFTAAAELSESFRLGLFPLNPEESFVQEIHGGERHLYVIEPPVERLLSFELAQEGLAMETFVLDGEGNLVLRTHCDESVLCGGVFSWIAEPYQSYLIVVLSKPTPLPGCYRISLGGSDVPTPEAVLAASAMALVSRAETALTFSATSQLDPVLQLYDSAARQWAALDQKGRLAEAYSRMGDALAAAGRNQEAMHYFRITSELWQYAGDATGEAYAEIRLGEASISLADAQGAIEHLSTALAYFSGKGNRHGQALALHDLGVIYYNIGDADEALRNYRRSLDLWPSLGERRGEAVTLMSAAAAYAELQEFNVAIDLNRQALALLRALGDSGVESSVLNNISLLYNDLGEFQKALDACYQSLELKRDSGDIRGQAIALSNLGLIYHNSGDLEQAYAFYSQALTMRRKAEDIAGEAATLNNIGKYYLDTGDFARALESFRASYSIIRRTGFRGSEASALRNLAQTEISMQEYAAAERDLNLAREIFVQLKDRAAEASCLTELGRIRVVQGEEAAAIDLYEEALGIMRSIGDRPGEAKVLLELARIYRLRNQREEAAKYAEDTIRILESIRSELLSHSLRVSYLSSSRNAYEFYVDLLFEMHELQPAAGYDAVAFRVSEGAHARVLSDLISEGGAGVASGGDPDLVEKEYSARRQLSEKQQALLELLNTEHSEEEERKLNEEIQSLRALVDQFAVDVRRNDPARRSFLLPAPARLSDIQEKLLDPESALVEFLVGKDRGFVWVVTHDQRLMYSIPGNAEIQKRVLALLRQVAVPPEETQAVAYAAARERLQSLSRDLGQLLLRPAAGMLKNKRILIVADGALQILPFALLQPWSATRPLGVDHEIVSLPSATSLLLMRQEGTETREPEKTIAVLADPVFDPSDPRIQAPSGSQKWLRSPQSLTLSRVPFTRREARSILKMVPPQQTLLALDSDASRDTLQDQGLADFRYIHIATHGILDTTRPELSALVLSLYDRDGRRLPGLMTPTDILDLRLNADLVVLSGCSTALGKDVRGEGLVGLVRAFMYAGARGVLASLWTVQDATTVEFMSYFYRALFERKMTPAAALHATQKYMWQQDRWRSPYYWAAFVLVGEYQ